MIGRRFARASDLKEFVITAKARYRGSADGVTEIYRLVAVHDGTDFEYSNDKELTMSPGRFIAIPNSEDQCQNRGSATP